MSMPAIPPGAPGVQFSRDSSSNPIALSTPNSLAAYTRLGVRTTPLRVATFGDSTANCAGNAGSGSTNACDQQILTAAFPASSFNSCEVSPDKFSLPMVYPQAYLVANGGISGATTTGMLARDTTTTATITNATPGVCTSNAHGLTTAVSTVRFTTTGTLPAPLLVNVPYWVQSTTTNTFTLSLTSGGAAIATTSAGSGTHTYVANTRKAITDILALSPDVVLLRGGSINDLTAVTSGTLAATVAATYANHVAIINRIISQGVPVIDSGVYGFSGSATDLASTRSALLQLNVLFAAYAATLPGRVTFIPSLGYLSDATGAFITGMCNSTDGTHLSLQGEMLHARKEAAVVTALFGASSGPRFQGENLVVNSLMANTGAQSYGTAAVGFAVGAANGTRQNGKIEVIDGKVWMTCELLATASAASLSINMPYDPANMGIIPGDVYGVEFDFMLAGVTFAAPPIPTSLLARFDTLKSGNGRVILEGLSPAVLANPFTETYTGHLSMGPFQFQEPSSNLVPGSSGFSITYATNDFATVGAFTYKIGVSMPRIVKLPDFSVPATNYASSVVAVGSAVALTTATVANVTSLVLNPGVWDVAGAVDFHPDATTITTYLAGGSSTVSATLGSQDSGFNEPIAVATTAQDPGSAIPVYRYAVPAGTTLTVYLVAVAGFTVSTLSAYGTLRARRVR